jgi:hypothetical protein
VVDTVAPVITVTAPLSASFRGTLSAAAATPITGSVTDGGGVAGMVALLFTPDGQLTGGGPVVVERRRLALSAPVGDRG